MITFQGIRVLPKGSQIYRQDFPKPEAPIEGEQPHVLKAPYILERHNPHFKRSTMLAYDFEGKNPRAFLYESMDVVSYPNGDKFWITRTPGGMEQGAKLTAEEVAKMDETEYRIIDGNDAYVFLEDASREEWNPVNFRDAGKKPGEENLSSWYQGWNDAVKILARNAVDMFLERKWFRNDRNLSEKISNFIEAQKQRATEYPDIVDMPVVETEPKIIALETKES